MSAPSPADIRAAREAVRLTQAQAAALIGRSLRVWQAYEGGARGLDPILWLVWRIRAGLLPAAAIVEGGPQRATSR